MKVVTDQRFHVHFPLYILERDVLKNIEFTHGRQMIAGLRCIDLMRMGKEEIQQECKCGSLPPLMMTYRIIVQDIFA